MMRARAITARVFSSRIAQLWPRASADLLFGARVVLHGAPHLAAARMVNMDLPTIFNAE